MKATGASLKTHMAGDATTLAKLWKVVRTDGQTFGFTDHDKDISYGGVTYESASGFSASALRNSAALDVDNQEIEGMLSSNRITDEDLLYGVWDSAAITIYRINWADTSMGVEILQTGTLGNVRSKDVAFSVEMRGLTQKLSQAVGRVYTPACDADLGDTRCGVTIGTYTVTGTVTATSAYNAFTDSGRAEAADYFKYGLVTWTSGNNSGRTMEVKSFSAGAFVLQQSMPEAIQVGDTYSVYAGCDKLLATCKTKFNNVINFQGFPHLPGVDRYISGG